MLYNIHVSLRSLLLTKCSCYVTPSTGEVLVLCLMPGLVAVSTVQLLVPDDG